MIEILLLFTLAVVLGWPLGRYLAAVARGAPMPGDRVFGWVEQPVYRLLGVDPASRMGWRGYAGAFLWSNLALAVPVWLIFMNQGWLPLNPNHAPGMSWDLALHTMVSFLTNTDQQHYAGQAQLSHLAQMTGIVGLQIVTPMMGLCVLVATLRGFFGGGRDGKETGEAEEKTGKKEAATVDVGNFWIDVTRLTVRFMLPLCLLWALLLTAEGVPSTLRGGPVAVPVDAAARAEQKTTEQKIPLGPVAAMAAAKQLGTNGGGWYGPNSAMPLENPTPFSNFLEMLALILIPVAVVFMVGAFTGRKKLAGLMFGCMLSMSLLSAGASVWLEGYSAAAGDIAVMEGKEVRLGAEASALWAALTTQTSNGSVNMMHDSAAPLSGVAMLSNMLVNAVWGGIGTGVQQFLVYLLLTAFLAGLMTGRTPELFGRKIEAPEIRLLAVLVIVQPLAILLPTACALAIPTVSSSAGISNPGFHGVTQVFYEYVSAFANNGSGFEGLGDNTAWWNLTCVAALILGRYPGLIVPLAIAAMLAVKKKTPEGANSLQVETPTFALTLIAVVAILTVLQFTPVMVLGPIAEHLSLYAH